MARLVRFAIKTVILTINTYVYKKGLLIYFGGMVFEIDHIVEFKQKYYLLVSSCYRLLELHKFLNAFKLEKSDELFPMVVHISSMFHKKTYEFNVVDNILYISADTLIFSHISQHTL